MRQPKNEDKLKMTLIMKTASKIKMTGPDKYNKTTYLKLTIMRSSIIMTVHSKCHL